MKNTNLNSLNLEELTAIVGGVMPRVDPETGEIKGCTEMSIPGIKPLMPFRIPKYL